jgi:hypothetical protein
MKVKLFRDVHADRARVHKREGREGIRKGREEKIRKDE